MTQDAEQLALRWGVPLILAFVAVIVRALLTSSKPTPLGIARGVAVGLFVGALVNLYLADQMPMLGDGARGAIVGASAIVAEDLVIAMLTLGRRVRYNPDLLLGWLSKKKD